jgi:hypothetical protein
MFADHWFRNPAADAVDVSTKEKTQFDLFSLLLRDELNWNWKREFFFSNIQFHAQTQIEEICCNFIQNITKKFSTNHIEYM